MAGVSSTDRDAWLLADDQALLAQCDVHRYRASGPGGQHRNKTASAVRLHHRPSGLIVTATERRSQHENRRVAVQRLREVIAVQMRCPFDASGVAPPAALAGVVVDGRLTIGARDPRCRILVGWTLDALAAFDGRMSDVARWLGLPTTRVVGLLRREPKRLAAANTIRSRFSMAPLR